MWIMVFAWLALVSTSRAQAKPQSAQTTEQSAAPPSNGSADKNLQA
jgi:hypothetical protein